MSLDPGRSVTSIIAGAMVLGSNSLVAQQPPTRMLEFDFPAVHVGVAEYDSGPTGTTVFYFPDGVTAAADVRGGSPGTVNAHAVRLGYEEAFVDAVVFSGGSWYGLSAATGVANGIKEVKREEGEYDHIAGVLGGIIYDVGGRRFSRVTPDENLGKAALRAARPNRFPMGAHGAGRFAMQGVYYVEGPGADAYARWPHSGQGGAFAQTGPTKVAVFTVVNALGTIVDRSGKVVRCHRNDAEAPCPPITELVGTALRNRTEATASGGGATSSTTLTLVVTNQRLSFAQLQRLAVQVHGSMARAIQPFATEADGDVLYAVTTNQVDNDELRAVDLGVLASELAWDAVLSSVPTLPEAPPAGATRRDSSRLEDYAGEYEFPGGGRLVIRTDGTTASATFLGNGRIYFDEDRSYDLIPLRPDVFIVDGPARDTIRFGVEGGRVLGLTLNPGPWAQSAQRIR